MGYETKHIRGMDKTVVNSSKGFFHVTTKINIFVMVRNLRNSIWNSNLTYHQFKDIQANFYYERAIYFTVAIISTHTHVQEQKDSNRNGYSCHGLRIKKFQLELLF